MKQSIIIVIAVMSIILGSCVKNTQSTSKIFKEWQAEVMNSNLPNLTLPSLDGQEISITEILDGKFGLISIWRSTCSHCQVDMPKLMDLDKSFASDDRFTILHISSDTDRNAAINFAKQLNIRDAVLFDPKITRLKDTNLSTRGTPTLFVVSPNAKIVAKIVGGRNWNAAKVKKQMKTLIDSL